VTVQKCDSGRRFKLTVDRLREGGDGNLLSKSRGCQSRPKRTQVALGYWIANFGCCGLRPQESRLTASSNSPNGVACGLGLLFAGALAPQGRLYSFLRSGKTTFKLLPKHFTYLFLAFAKSLSWPLSHSFRQNEVLLMLSATDLIYTGSYVQYPTFYWYVFYPFSQYPSFT
jgi:hypothetical protein